MIKVKVKDGQHNIRLLIMTDCCGLEEALKDDEWDIYDKLLDNPTDEEVVSYFEKNYPEYCDIITIPEDATDFGYTNNDSDLVEVMIVRNGIMETIYSKDLRFV